jgi:hypothetical protein
LEELMHEHVKIPVSPGAIAKVRTVVPIWYWHLYFDPVPLLSDEDPAVFCELILALIGHYSPERDKPLQWAWVAGVAFHLWEKRRKLYFKQSVLEHSIASIRDIKDVQQEVMSSFRGSAATKEKASPESAATNGLKQGEAKKGTAKQSQVIVELGEALKHCLSYYERLDLLSFQNDAALSRLLRDAPMFWEKEISLTPIVGVAALPAQTEHEHD